MCNFPCNFSKEIVNTVPEVPTIYFLHLKDISWYASHKKTLNPKKKFLDRQNALSESHDAAFASRFSHSNRKKMFHPHDSMQEPQVHGTRYMTQEFDFKANTSKP